MNRRGSTTIEGTLAWTLESGLEWTREGTQLEKVALENTLKGTTGTLESTPKVPEKIAEITYLENFEGILLGSAV